MLIDAFSLNDIHKKGRGDLVISIFLSLYILSSYFLPTTFTNQVGRVVFYGFLGLTLFKSITKQTPLKVTSYNIWYFYFGILGLVSAFYALNRSKVFYFSYQILVCWIVAFSFMQYVQNHFDIKRIFLFYAYSPSIAVLYLFLSGQLNAQSERLGQSLFGNANILALILMISLFCVAWLMVYGPMKYLILNIFWGLLILFVIGLTGGRKYFLLPFIFLSLLLILKNWQKNIMTSLVFLILLMSITLAVFWAVMNIPALYSMIGIRFEGLLNFLTGDIAGSDDSTIVRYLMIENGWHWFQNQPILGYGLNNFSFLFSQVLYDVYAHNNYIELMVDLGILGVIVYYAFYVYIIAKLIKIRNDVTGVRNFFIAFMVVLLLFEIGAVTYQFTPIQIFLGLASAYIWLDGMDQKNAILN
jgi:O-antigen ligase